MPGHATDAFESLAEACLVVDAIGRDAYTTRVLFKLSKNTLSRGFCHEGGALSLGPLCESSSSGESAERRSSYVSVRRGTRAMSSALVRERERAASILSLCETGLGASDRSRPSARLAGVGLPFFSSNSLVSKVVSSLSWIRCARRFGVVCLKANGSWSRTARSSPRGRPSRRWTTSSAASPGFDASCAPSTTSTARPSPKRPGLVRRRRRRVVRPSKTGRASLAFLSLSLSLEKGALRPVSRETRAARNGSRVTDLAVSGAGAWSDGWSCCSWRRRAPCSWRSWARATPRWVPWRDGVSVTIEGVLRGIVFPFDRVFARSRTLSRSLPNLSIEKETFVDSSRFAVGTLFSVRR